MNIKASTYVIKLVPRGVRNWIKSPRHTLRWLWDGARYLLGANRSLLIRPSWLLTCHPAAYRFAQHEQIDDLEQKNEFDGFIRTIGPGTVLLDVGAHFGIFSLAALQHGGHSARAVAVDASPTATRMIRIQARLNHFDSTRLAVVNAMVGASSGSGEMVPVGVIAGGYFVSPSTSHLAADKVRVPMTTVDELVRQHNIVPTHLKIDVEGAEASVLSGAIRTLSLHSPLLFIECHNKMIRQSGGDPNLIFDVLNKLGYSMYDVDGHFVAKESLLSTDLIRVVVRKLDQNSIASF